MTVHSVSDVTRYIKGMFEHEPILSDLLIRGEVSNYKHYPSGHAYFTLKDAGASMKCVMFNGYARNLRFAPENGMQVIAGGNISVYERDGAYQLYVSSLTPEGATHRDCHVVGGSGAARYPQCLQATLAGRAAHPSSRSGAGRRSGGTDCGCRGVFQ